MGPRWCCCTITSRTSNPAPRKAPSSMWRLYCRAWSQGPGAAPTVRRPALKERGWQWGASWGPARRGQASHRAAKWPCRCQDSLKSSRHAARAAAGGLRAGSSTETAPISWLRLLSFAGPGTERLEVLAMEPTVGRSQAPGRPPPHSLAHSQGARGDPLQVLSEAAGDSSLRFRACPLIPNHGLFRQAQPTAARQPQRPGQ